MERLVSPELTGGLGRRSEGRTRQRSVLLLAWAMPTAEAPVIAAALLAHFDTHRRPMPWRETSDPYAIWVSEVMLQQTRVDTVVPYWERWVERFPTVAELAEAELDDVLNHWQGLGYYSRARNLHSAARIVRERHGGALPGDVEALRKLPGVGEYTAGAVASIAFGVPTPAVDGNVRRVLSRIHDIEAPTAAELRERAAELVPEDRPGDFNQALMELGATICTPRRPSCERCPVAQHCEARRAGVQEIRPLPVKRKAIPEERFRTLVLVRNDGAVLLTRRPLNGLLGGLWEFPGEPYPEEEGSGRRSPGRPSVRLENVVHTFSHKRIVYEPFLVRLAKEAEEPGKEAGAEGVEAAWVPLDRLMEYPLPVAQQKIAAAARSQLDAAPAVGDAGSS